MSEVDALRRELAELREQNAALLADRVRVEALFEHASDYIQIVDSEARIVYASAASRPLFGYEPSELLGRSGSELAHPDDIAKLQVAFSKVAQGPSGTSARVEIRIRHHDGSWRWVESKGTNLLDQPAIRGIVVSCRDVSDRRRVHDDADTDRARFQAMIERADECISLTSATGTTLYMSPAIEKLIGRAPSELLGGRAFDLVADEDVSAVANLMAKITTIPGGTLRAEFRLKHRDGSARWVEAAGTNLLEDPRVGAIVANFRDISARRQAAEALAESEQRYRQIVEATSDGVWICNAEGFTVFMSARMAAMLGYEVNDAIGMHVSAFHHPDDTVAIERRWENRRKGAGERSHMRLRRRDGTYARMSVQADSLMNPDGTLNAVLAIVSDVTDALVADEVRSRLAAIVESSEDAIVSYDLSGTILTWNRGATRLYGYGADEAIGKPISILHALEDRQSRTDLLPPSRGETVFRAEGVRVRKDGTRIETAISISSIRDSKGEIIGISNIAQDLTERRKSEDRLRRAEEQLRQSQKMEAVGRLAGGIAHDFNNLLSVILSYSDLAINDLRAGDPLRDDLTEIKKASERATDLTRQLLAFGRQQVLNPRVLDLGNVVSSMDRMLGRLVGEDVEMTLLNARQLGRVHADPSQIEQVIVNLAVNARDAMPRGGKLTIETANVDLTDAYVGEHLDVIPGSYVMLAISDTGVGMDEATRTHIFEPFFTTKAKGKGTGLGLSMVFGIAQQSGGHVTVYSEPGKGTTFKLFLPRSDQPSEPAPASTYEPASQRGSETILLVEDEVQLRTVTRAILRRHGFNVLEAQNGGDAFLISEQFPAKIHLLLTDVVMPRIGGRELAEKLAEMRPEMRVLFTSGYTDDAIVHHGVLHSDVSFLHKPFTPEALVRKVRETLDDSRLSR